MQLQLFPKLNTTQIDHLTVCSVTHNNAPDYRTNALRRQSGHGLLD